MNLFIEDGIKKFRSENYNYNFNLKTGYFERWGKTYEDDPEYSPFGPEIWDAEISEKCNGINNIPCPFCYKGNVGNKGRNTSLADFIKMFDVLPKYNGIPLVTQIAAGIGDIDSNPELFDIMQYCRDNGVVPNITINGDRLTEEIIDKLVYYCGAISVSRYDDKDICYNAIKKLTDRGMKQINIHQMISLESYDNCIQVIKDRKSDPRLKDMNAIVFLGLKQKGRGESFNILPNDKFEHLIRTAMNEKVSIGFDSCTANKVSQVFKNMGILEQYDKFIEPCESTSFSFYTSVDCKFYPCSFAEDVTTGIDVLRVNDFIKDIWNNKNTCIERKRIQDNGRSCPYFTV